MKDLRLVFSDILLYWAFKICPTDTQDKEKIAEFIVSYIKLRG